MYKIKKKMNNWKSFYSNLYEAQSPPKPTKNSTFDQLKPNSPTKTNPPVKKEDIFSDQVLSDASDSDGSIISDGMTTGHDSDYLTTV